MCGDVFRPRRVRMRAHGGTHRATLLRRDPPICTPSFGKKPQKPNSSLSFPITFSSQHRHRTTSIQILPQLLPSSPFRPPRPPLLSPSYQTRPCGAIASTHSRVARRDLVVVISKLKRRGKVTHDLYDSLQLIANTSSAVCESQPGVSFGCGGGFNEDLRTLPRLLIQ